jgi:hypothetical protein
MGPLSRRAGAALAISLVVAAGGCAELQAPPASARIPPVLGAGNPDPVRGAVPAAARAFGDQGRSLAGRPAAAARAAAQLELITDELARDPRWAPLPPSVGFELRSARTELRAALGTHPDAPPEAVIRALASAYAALAREDRAAAVAALSPQLFTPGGEETLERLTAPGPLPQSGIATALAEQEVTRMERDRRWGLGLALDPSSQGPLPGMSGRSRGTGL